MVTYRDNEVETSLKVYLQEIGQTPLLTPAEEIVLARRIQRGDATARTHMIKANLRLVVKIAQDYANMGLPLLDLISEGNIGLMKAVERFNPSKGAKLSTYAAWWIKQSIRRALANQGKTIRLPVHMVDRVRKMHKASFALSEELGREPNDEELAERMGQSGAQVAQLRRISMRPSSLDAPIGEDETEFGEIVMDEGAADAYDILHNKTLHEDVRLLLKDLDERESLILTMRYGLNGNQAMTLEKVGRKFKVTRERIRQLQNLALTKLRRSMEKRDRPITPQQN
ncbi:MAG: sigma-70 family RNA polymerase sigma factor [Verrucomicrobiae bacterium]|nr:sigma-70 family RNA polymerase sigma factor [Verrucomicrobiae bacterium]